MDGVISIEKWFDREQQNERKKDREEKKNEKEKKMIENKELSFDSVEIKLINEEDQIETIDFTFH